MRLSPSVVPKSESCQEGYKPDNLRPLITWILSQLSFELGQEDQMNQFVLKER